MLELFLETVKIWDKWAISGNKSKCWSAVMLMTLMIHRILITSDSGDYCIRVS